MSTPIKSFPSNSSSGSSGPALASSCSGIGRSWIDGSPNPEFELNHPEAKGASILLARRNFGCGSSREHAPWALEDYGFRVIIAPSFADIFYNNCFKNGMLPIRLSEAEVEELFRASRQTCPLRTHRRSWSRRSSATRMVSRQKSMLSRFAATACSMAWTISAKHSSMRPKSQSTKRLTVWLHEPAANTSFRSNRFQEKGHEGSSHVSCSDLSVGQ